MSVCSHRNTRLSTRRCTRQARGSKKNTKAHGGLCLVVDCTDCGEAQETNIRGEHTEHGSWGEPCNDDLERRVLATLSIATSLLLDTGDWGRPQAYEDEYREDTND